MPSLLDLPTELILKISDYLPVQTAVIFSCANQKIHDILNDTRLAPKCCLRTLATAIAKQGDSTLIQRIFGALNPENNSYEPSLHAAFEPRNFENLPCSTECHQGNNRDWVANLFLDAIVQGHEVAIKYFIELWPRKLESALVGAAAGGHTAMVERLIKEGANIDADGPEDIFCDYNTTIIERFIDLDGPKHWRKREMELAYDSCRYYTKDIRDDFRLRLTPIAWAAANGHLEIVKVLVHHKVQIDIRDDFGFTPLCWAANQGRLAVVSYILNLLPTDQSQHSALRALEVAGARDQSKVVILLWNFLTLKPIPTSRNAAYLIEAATVCQDITLLSRLLDNGFDTQFRMQVPWFQDLALLFAIRSHNIGILKLLRERLYTSDTEELLLEAIKEKDETIFSYLLGLVDAKELSPKVLKHATSCEPIFNKLCSAGVDLATLLPRIQKWIVQGLTYVVKTVLVGIGSKLEAHLDKPILYCAIQGGKPMFEFLLEQHLWDRQLSHIGPEAGTAIHLAVKKGDVKLLEVFFERGFPYTSEHDLILEAAGTEMGYLTLGHIFDLLLTRKPEVLNELNSEGESVLFQLISSKNAIDERVVELLLDRGADPLQQNRNGKTPLDEATRNSCQFKCFRLMVRYLRQRKDWDVLEKYVAWVQKIRRKTAEEFLLKIAMDSLGKQQTQRFMACQHGA
jgi:ankyrin repeat protein